MMQDLSSFVRLVGGVALGNVTASAGVAGGRCNGFRHLGTAKKLEGGGTTFSEFDVNSFNSVPDYRV